MNPSKAPAARELLLLALGLGLLGDLLLRPTPPGLGVALWTLAFAVSAIVWRPRVATLGAAYPVSPLAVAAVFGLGFVWRDSPILQALFGVGAMTALATAFLDRPSRAGATSHAIASSAAAASAVLVSPLVVALAHGGRVGAGSGLRVGFVGALLAAPLLLVFGTLFAAADPLFALYASDLARNLDEVARHLVTILALAWLGGGLIAGLALARCPADLELGRPRAAIGSVVVVAVALVVALFAAFLAVQARAFLGGNALIEARIGLSYAEYARQGFFQLLACAGIALPLVLVADWAVAPGDPRRRRTLVLSGALVLMVLAVLASAARRMVLYVDAYGVTELRLYASAIMVWLTIAFIAFAIGALFGARERFAFHALAAGGAVILVLGILDPAAAIVRFNAARVPESVEGFDAAYATSLGSDAVPALLDALPSLPFSPRCAVARELLARSRAGSEPDWRTLNISRARARALLAASASELEKTEFVCSITRLVAGTRGEPFRR
ncbi:MAG TPA: DUF4173 domain-containing protein [Gemmatimonadota bacterium]|nr:DUF4173 domain-containing protein [Gemmatimonadota bacterium]